jgi:hypothetical protein
MGIIYALHTYSKDAIGAPPALPCVEVSVRDRYLRVIDNRSIAHR